MSALIGQHFCMTFLQKKKIVRSSQRCVYKALLNILTSDKFDTFSSSSYQHHNFYNLLSSDGTK